MSVTCIDLGKYQDRFHIPEDREDNQLPMLEGLAVLAKNTLATPSTSNREALVNRFYSDMTGWLKAAPSYSAGEMRTYMPPHVAKSLVRVGQLDKAIQFIKENGLEDNPLVHERVGEVLRNQGDLKGFMRWCEAFPKASKNRNVLTACLVNAFAKGELKLLDGFERWLDQSYEVTGLDRTGVATAKNILASVKRGVVDQEPSVQDEIKTRLFSLASQEIREAMLRGDYEGARALILEQPIGTSANVMLKATLAMEASQMLGDLKVEEAELWLKDKVAELKKEGAQLWGPLEDAVGLAVSERFEADRMDLAFALINRYQFSLYHAKIADIAGQILRIGMGVPSDGLFYRTL
ncbi:MAG: hypothetical protein KDK78_00440 [Chlamydiia bacterium]|nr:hypothetical protein [Chlamydiia bacterium]